MNNTIMPVNTQFIRAEMRKQHLSTIQLAKRMNVDPTTIWKILSRKRGITNFMSGFRPCFCHADRIEKVADYFGVSTDYLLGRTSDPHPQNDGLTGNQKRVAYSIDPDISDDEREAIISMVKEAMKLRKRI